MGKKKNKQKPVEDFSRIKASIAHVEGVSYNE